MPKERVIGVGGIFVAAADPVALTTWYADMLGVVSPPASYDMPSWWPQPGPLVVAALPEDSSHFGGASHRWSLNFRVSDLDAMVAQLRAGGIEVEVDPASYPNGRFASLVDPEGNVVQLWQPDGADASG